MCPVVTGKYVSPERITGILTAKSSLPTIQTSNEKTNKQLNTYSLSTWVAFGDDILVEIPLCGQEQVLKDLNLFSVPYFCVASSGAVVCCIDF